MPHEVTLERPTKRYLATRAKRAARALTRSDALLLDQAPAVATAGAVTTLGCPNAEHARATEAVAALLVQPRYHVRIARAVVVVQTRELQIVLAKLEPLEKQRSTIGRELGEVVRRRIVDRYRGSWPGAERRHLRRRGSKVARERLAHGERVAQHATRHATEQQNVADRVRRDAMHCAELVAERVVLHGVIARLAREAELHGSQRNRLQRLAVEHHDTDLLARIRRAVDHATASVRRPKVLPKWREAHGQELTRSIAALTCVGNVAHELGRVRELHQKVVERSTAHRGHRDALRAVEESKAWRDQRASDQDTIAPHTRINTCNNCSCTESRMRTADSQHQSQCRWRSEAL